MRPSPRVRMTRRVVAGSPPRSCSVLCVVSGASSAGKACTVMVDQSCLGLGLGLGLGVGVGLGVGLELGSWFGLGLGV